MSLVRLVVIVAIVGVAIRGLGRLLGGSRPRREVRGGGAPPDAASRVGKPPIRKEDIIDVSIEDEAP